MRTDNQKLLDEFRRLMKLPREQAWAEGKKLLNRDRSKYIALFAQPRFWQSVTWKKYARYVSRVAKVVRK